MTDFFENECWRAVENSDYGALKRSISEEYANLKNSAGSTILMVAVCEGNIRIIKLLIEYGADVNVRNKEGYNALYFADKKKIKEILINAGAKQCLIQAGAKQHVNYLKKYERNAWTKE